jgi:hypothetical protein
LAVSYLLRSKPKEGVKVQIFSGSLLLQEITGTSNLGLNTVQWNMTGRRERTPEEAKAAPEAARRPRGQGDPSSFPVQPGEYRIVLTVDGKSQSAVGTVLKDPRF